MSIYQKYTDQGQIGQIEIINYGKQALGFLVNDGEIYLFTKQHLNRCLPGDTVYYQEIDVAGFSISDYKYSPGKYSKLTSCNKPWKFATVTGIATRQTNSLVGVIVPDAKKINLIGNRNCYNCIPYKQAYPTFRIASKLNRTDQPQYCEFKFHSWPEDASKPRGEIIQYIGNIAESKTVYQAAMINYLGRTVISGSTKIEADTSTDLFSDCRVEIPKTRQIFTVDPEGSTDFDDAFHYEIVDGIATVYVHIADVNSYPIDMDGLISKGRFTSIYLPEHKINMFSDKLADDQFSLKKGVPRRAITVKLGPEIEIFHSMIYVTSNLTYEKANAILSDSSSYLHEYFQAVADLVGESDFHKIVEKLMIQTNLAIGQHLAKSETGIFRVTEPSGKNVGALSLIKNLRAYYSIEKGYHEVLDAENYTHFTSPIRRCADILAHCLVCQRSPFSKEKLADLCQKINNYDRLNKKLYRDAQKLELVFRYGDCVLDVTGLIVAMDGVCFTVYLEEFKILHQIFIYHPELHNSVFYYESGSEDMTVKRVSDHKIVETYKLYQPISLKVILNPSAIRTKDKFRVLRLVLDDDHKDMV